MSVERILSVKHVLPLTTIRRERRLPVPGTVPVRLSEKVLPTDVVAEAEVAPRHVFIDLARGLGVSARDVGRYLTRERGERVETGEVIAGPVGITRRTVRAPADGRIVKITDGRVLFEIRPAPYEIRAGFPGTVTATDGSRVVTVETVGALIQAEWGNGLQEWGVIRVVGERPEDQLQTDRLDIELRGAIVVAGICDNPAPLHQAAELSLRGLVLGSMPADLIPVAQRQPFPVMVTDGFGALPMNAPAFELIQSNSGREAALDASMGDRFGARRPEIIIPLPASSRVELPAEFVPLKPGVRVRVVRPPHHGAVGVVREVVPKAVDFPSGIRSRGASVDLEGIGLETIPLANLEILQ